MSIKFSYLDWSQSTKVQMQNKLIANSKGLPSKTKLEIKKKVQEIKEKKINEMIKGEKLQTRWVPGVQMSGTLTMNQGNVWDKSSPLKYLDFYFIPYKCKS